MKIILAGYNVDTDGLKELKRNKKGVLTPESISAAYARISRSPKPVNELRAEARRAIAQARKSNSRIIFEMGHHSIAEHAVFNFDIIGISRRAVEELEKFRLCSYTEKSQRYVTLKGDFTVPREIERAGFRKPFIQIVRQQNKLYQTLFRRIRNLYLKKSNAAQSDHKLKKALENLAKEDARYVLSMATQTQLGATINARNLELMIRRFASHQLDEIQTLGGKMHGLVKKIAPSIILFCSSNEYDADTYDDLSVYAKRIAKFPKKKREKDVELIGHTPNADERILAVLAFRSSRKTYKQCYYAVRRMGREAKNRLFMKSLERMELYDRALREFEYANLTYSLIVSAGCFGQLKRHRMASIATQDYDPGLGWTMPPVIKEIRAQEDFKEIMEKSELLYYRIEKKLPGLGSYILTNAHRKRVLMVINLRELYHVSRLRQDPTAQWDIRDKSEKMSHLAKKAIPITTQLLGGKSDYPKIYEQLYKRLPKVTKVPEL